MAEVIACLHALGAHLQGTNFDTKPTGAYQLLVGGKVYEVRVPEEMVMTGAVIKI